ncbi:ferredoxin [Halobacteriovorax sp. XZX-3]|uniref:ferredoxin n=1 Tax=unclassified Halobacteriovorax TaxID=2639665 RepID=UPI0018EA442F|nr:ferredoxin [Halobacteriovorax sp. DA5]
MNTTLIALAIALLVVTGMVVQLGVLSLLSGSFFFLFGKSKFEVLKSSDDESFAFGYRWNNSRQPAKFNHVTVRLFNPFGKKTQVTVSSDFAVQDSDFGIEVKMGPAFKDILELENLDSSTVEIELKSKDGVTQSRTMKGRKFIEAFRGAENTVETFNEKYGYVKPKMFYHQTTRSFIADAIPQGDIPVGLRISANPQFAGEFAGAAGAGAPAQENFAVSKVWIEEGCIVCNACEGIYPEVFEVTDTNCVIRPDAPLDNGLLILEAAEACPTEVIKFNKA